MVDAMTKLGKADLAADPWVPTSMATVLTMIKFMNEVGADKLTPQAIADKAKAFKGPLVFGAPEVQCGEVPRRAGGLQRPDAVLRLQRQGPVQERVRLRAPARVTLADGSSSDRMV